MDGPRISVRVSPSRRQWKLLLALHAGAAVSVLSCGLSTPWQSALLLVVLASVFREWLRYATAVRAGGIVLGFDGESWRIEERGVVTRMELLPDSRVLPRTVVVRLRSPGSRRARSLLLLPDSADADELRRLRVCLRLRKGLASCNRGARPRPL